MPTLLQRTTITHSPVVENALAEAASRWPEVAGSNSALVSRVLGDWAAGSAQRRASDAEARARRIRAAAGGFRNVYGPGYLDGVREGWHS